MPKVKHFELNGVTYDAFGQETQYSTLPTASLELLGQIVQYVGATDANYTNGYFYKCVSDGESEPTYSWENVKVQSGAKTYDLGTILTTSLNQTQRAILQEWLINFKETGEYSNISFKNSNGEILIVFGVKTYDYSTELYFNFQSYNGGVAGDYIYNRAVRFSISHTQDYTITNIQLINSSIPIPILYYNSNTQEGLAVLSIENAKAYTPTANYHPSTKLYSDTVASTAESNAKAYTDSLVGEIRDILATLTTPASEEPTSEEPTSEEPTSEEVEEG